MAATRSTKRKKCGTGFQPVKQCGTGFQPVKQKRARAATAPIRNPQSPAEPFKEGDVLHVSFSRGLWRGRLEHDGTVVRVINSSSILVVAFSVLDAAKQRMKAEG